MSKYYLATTDSKRSVATFEDDNLMVEVEYWPHLCRWDDGAGYLSCDIRLTNKNKKNICLTDIKVTIDVDDDGMYWDAYTCDGACNRQDPQVREIPGTLMPGGKAKTSYSWMGSNIVDPFPDEKFTASIVVIPQYTVVYDATSGFKVNSVANIQGDKQVNKEPQP